MKQNGTDDATNLTERQLVALPYLTASVSLSEGARLANVGRTTLYRWLEDSEFRRELERLRGEAAALARVELNGLMLKGIVVLAEAMEDPNLFVRVRGAQAALSLALKAIDTKELQQRLDRLDDAIALWFSRNASP